MDWLKKNKLAVVLILVVVYLFWRQNSVIPCRNYASVSSGIGGSVPEMAVAPKSVSRSFSSFLPQAAPVETADRMVVQESSLSLVVKDVRDTAEKVSGKAKEAGGYLISSSLSQPEEAPYANLFLRVPADKLNEVLAFYRNLAIKVSSENLFGHDVTDEYVDLEARLATHQKTKEKFEAILKTAVKVQDILEVNRELINLQAQIDDLKGRQKYLEQTAKLAKISVYLSTDELALPYAPSETFRPLVIIKQAVRSLVLTLRKLATAVIWALIYLPIWILLFLGYLLVKKIKNLKKTKKN